MACALRSVAPPGMARDVTTPPEARHPGTFGFVRQPSVSHRGPEAGPKTQPGAPEALLGSVLLLFLEISKTGQGPEGGVPSRILSFRSGLARPRQPSAQHAQG
ncbi:hypothetical protein NN561_019014 [Cricetulus griseus]